MTVFLIPLTFPDLRSVGLWDPLGRMYPHHLFSCIRPCYGIRRHSTPWQRFMDFLSRVAGQWLLHVLGCVWCDDWLRADGWWLAGLSASPAAGLFCAPWLGVCCAAGRWSPCCWLLAGRIPRSVPVSVITITFLTHSYNYGAHSDNLFSDRVWSMDKTVWTSDVSQAPGTGITSVQIVVWIDQTRLQKGVIVHGNSVPTC